MGDKKKEDVKPTGASVNPIQPSTVTPPPKNTKKEDKGTPI